jgi:hypothetical protein
MLENRDVFGAAVHTANRMTSQAKAGQIVTTAAMGGAALAGVACRMPADRHRDAQGPGITIGRAEDNDVVVKGNLISRLHARIEVNRNKFVLIDQSTNGTFVQSSDGEESFVRRDSLQIRGRGMIGLGRLPEQGSPQTIRFSCEEG